MKTMPFAAVLFDLDGTLFDPAGDLVPAVTHTLTTHGYHCAPAAVIREHISGGSKAMLQAAAQIPIDAETMNLLLPTFSQYYQSNIANHSALFSGMDAVLKRLETEKIHWGIVTNKFQRFAQAFVKATQMDKRLSVLVCGDTLPRAKPHPDPLFYACQQLDVAPQDCVYIGDSANDMRAGKAAGMYTIACRYGYLAADADPKTWQADAIIDAPQDLYDLLWTAAR